MKKKKKIHLILIRALYKTLFIRAFGPKDSDFFKKEYNFIYFLPKMRRCEHYGAPLLIKSSIHSGCSKTNPSPFNPFSWTKPPDSTAGACCLSLWVKDLTWQESDIAIDWIVWPFIPVVHQSMSLRWKRSRFQKKASGRSTVEFLKTSDACRSICSHTARTASRSGLLMT